MVFILHKDQRPEKEVPIQSNAKFTVGNLLKHILVMSSASSVGLLFLFSVDILDLFFISLLGKDHLAAAVGFAGTLIFYTTSISIGLSIAMGALISNSIGKNNIAAIRSYAGNVSRLSLMLTIPIAIGLWFFAPDLLSFLGADGPALDLAVSYLRIIIPSFPLLAISMGFMAIIRSFGDAKRSMYLLILGGIINAIFDPIFIFGFNLGVEGAAMASVLSRIITLAVSFYIITKYHDLKYTKFQFQKFKKDLRKILQIALPAITTNLATPIGNSFVISVVASYGTNAVAGMSVIGRITPVAFALLFALSGAIGPIVGQNLGAKKYTRVIEAIHTSIFIIVCYVLCVSMILFFTKNYISNLFQLEGIGKELFMTFSSIISWSFIFTGFVFVANATLNNIGKAYISTIINFAKATIFTMPFVYIGSKIYGAPGILYGQALGYIIIGVISLIWTLWIIRGVK